MIKNKETESKSVKCIRTCDKRSFVMYVQSNNQPNPHSIILQFYSQAESVLVCVSAEVPLSCLPGTSLQMIFESNLSNFVLGWLLLWTDTANNLLSQAQMHSASTRFHFDFSL